MKKRLPGTVIGHRTRMVKLSSIWKMARQYAEEHGLQHSYAGVQGVAPL